MNKKFYSIIALLFVLIVISYIKYNFNIRSDWKLNSAGSAEISVPPSFHLDPSIFTEKFIDINIKKGILKAEVESIFGSPYHAELYSLNNETAYYRIRRPLKKGLIFSAFTISYKNGLVDHVDKEWSAEKTPREPDAPQNHSY